MSITAAPVRRPRMPSARTLGLGALVLVLFALVIALTPTRAGTGTLDPAGSGQTGARALTQVLGAHGVKVIVVRSAAELAAAVAEHPAKATTVVFGDSTYLRKTAVAEMARAAPVARWVVLYPSQGVLDGLGLPVENHPSIDETRATATAKCTSVFVASSDEVNDPGSALRLASTQAAVSCFGPADDALWLELRAAADRPATTVIGFSDNFDNRHIIAASHAGMAVRALGEQPTLIWVHADATALPADIDEAAESVWPAWLGPVGAVLFTAVVALALARGRRLGPLVAEPMPVVVRAVETTQSRARLYHRARDRERAAHALRLATTRRLATRIGASRSLPTDQVSRLVADLTGTDATHVNNLLAGPVPADDGALTTLATGLAELEERVRAI